MLIEIENQYFRDITCCKARYKALKIREKRELSES
jgi:hypothetical protein